jgi:serine/threonine protein kinase
MSSQQHPSSEQTVWVRGVRRSYLERQRIGRAEYFLLERIGGFFRERFQAFDPRSGPGGDFFLIQRLPDASNLEQRRRVLRRLKHDNFPRVWHWQRRDGAVDVVMSWVEGVPLDRYFETIRGGCRTPVDPGHAVRWIHGLANAVCHLHRELQVVHGDIQPANVILTSHPCRLVLIDFGSAWTTQAAMFRSEGDGHHRGYAAPELQTAATPVGFHADQFSVMVLFYELLTQQLPYDGLGGKAGRPEFATLAQHGLLLPSRLPGRCQNLPRSLRDRIDRLCRIGLALDPNDRYAGGPEWLNDLFDVMARFRMKPELPRAESALTRLVEWFVTPKRT